MDPILRNNKDAWDDRVRRRLRHTRRADAQALTDPLGTVDPEGWLQGNIHGWRVLCLAAGGGMQSILYAAAGAQVTVVDLSPAMLEQDREESRRHDLPVRTVEASMDDLSSLGDAAFDLVIQPVSTCYVADVAPVFQEVARVLVPGGQYISQHKQPVSLQTDVEPLARGYRLGELYHRTGPLPPAPEGLMHREAGTLEFLHRWETLLGGICRAGLVIENFSEPRLEDPSARPGTAPHRYAYAPPYFKVLARRPAQTQPKGPQLWTP